VAVIYLRIVAIDKFNPWLIAENSSQGLSHDYFMAD